MKDWLLEDLQRLVVIGKYYVLEEKERLLPIASHCSLGVRRCRDLDCPVYKEMKQKVEDSEK